MWGDISSWFWFAFPWWLVMSNIFSCTGWISIGLAKRFIWVFLYHFMKKKILINFLANLVYVFFGKMSIHIQSPIYQIFFTIELYVCVFVWILIPYQIYVWQIFSPFSRMYFLVVNNYLQCAETSLVWCSHICLLWLSFPLLFEVRSKNSTSRPISRSFPPVFS